MSLLLKLIFVVAAFLVVLLCYAIYSLRKDESHADFTVITVVEPRNGSEFGPLWAKLVDADGKALILQRAEFYAHLKGSEKVWRGLSEGQEVILHHSFRGWNVFGHLVTWTHEDKLELKSQ